MTEMGADAEVMFAAYEDSLVRRKMSDTTLREYRKTTTTFLQWMRAQGLEVEEVRRPHIEHFFQDTGWAPSTQWARLHHLRAPWRYAVHELEMIPKTPFDGLGIKLERPPELEPKTLSNRELRAIKANVSGATDWTLFHLLAYTGMRSMEIRRLTWNDVILSEGRLNCVGKGNRGRAIPIHPLLQEALVDQGVWARGAAYVVPGRGGMITGQGIWNKTNRMDPARGASPHDFRRTFITSLLSNGAIESAVKQIVGHTRRADITFGSYTRMPQRILYRELLKVYSDDPL